MSNDEMRKLAGNIMNRNPWILFTVLLLVFVTNDAVAKNQMIGSIKTLEGAPLVIRNNQSLDAELGIKLYEKDTLRTGPQGSMGVILRDDTVLSLGPDSEIILHRFVFKPVKGDLAIITKLLKGTLAYLSGQIGKLSPQAVRLETPVATVGVRGTRFVVKVMGE